MAAVICHAKVSCLNGIKHKIIGTSLRHEKEEMGRVVLGVILINYNVRVVLGVILIM